MQSDRINQSLFQAYVVALQILILEIKKDRERYKYLSSDFYRRIDYSTLNQVWLRPTAEIPI